MGSLHKTLSLRAVTWTAHRRSKQKRKLSIVKWPPKGGGIFISFSIIQYSSLFVRCPRKKWTEVQFSCNRIFVCCDNTERGKTCQYWNLISASPFTRSSHFFSSRRRGSWHERRRTRDRATNSANKFAFFETRKTISLYTNYADRKERPESSLRVKRGERRRDDKNNFIYVMGETFSHLMAGWERGVLSGIRISGVETVNLFIT